MSGSEWSPKMVEDLSQAWERGDSTATIARDLGVSKNAIIGKARRIGLPSRENPVKTARIAALVVEGSAAGVARPTKLRKKQPTSAPQALADAPAELPVTQSPPPPRSPPEGCRWPLWGHHEAPTHRYCGEPRRTPVDAYCPLHAEQAFTRVTRLEAA